MCATNVCVCKVCDSTIWLCMPNLEPHLLTHFALVMSVTILQDLKEAWGRGDLLDYQALLVSFTPHSDGPLDHAHACCPHFVVVGSKGDKGDRGVVGAQGLKGTKGSKGEPGARGASIGKLSRST